MSLMPESGNTIPVRRLLKENRWPLIAGKMTSRQIYYKIHNYIENIIFMLTAYISILIKRS